MSSITPICVRLQLTAAFIIWLESCAPVSSFSTSSTFTIARESKYAEDHHTLFAISPNNKKLATSRTESVDASLHAEALLKEEQVTSVSRDTKAIMFEKAWIPLNRTAGVENNADTISMNIEDLLVQYEKLLEHTQERPYIEESRDTLLEPHTTTYDEKDIVNTAKKPVQIYGGGSTLYKTNTASEQVEPAVNKEISLNSISSGISGLSDVWKARILLIISAALYGTNFTVVKILNDYIPTDVGAVLRFALAAGVTLPWLFRQSYKEKIADEELDGGDTFLSTTSDLLPIEKSTKTLANLSFMDTPIFAGLEVGMWTAIGYLAQAEGLETIDAGKSAFICSLAVVTVPILDFLAGKKMLSREVLGAFLAVIGVGFLEIEGAGSTFQLNTGDMLSLVQPVAFGLGFWRMEAAMKRFPEDAMKTTAAQLLAVFVISLNYCLISSGGIDGLPDMSQVISWISDPMILGALCWTGLVTTAFTVYLETLALKTLTAAETTMIFSTEPLFGATFAAAVMGETFGPSAIIGGALILAGCIFSNLDFDSFQRDEL